MQRINLQVEPRDLGQKNPNQWRQEGLVPAVVYGHGKPETVIVDLKTLKKAIHTDAGTNALFNVTLSGKTSLSIIKEIQRDIFTQEPIHVDFMRINVKEKILVHIPVHLTGTPVGVKNSGGILEHMQREIDLKCLPDQIPPHIDVDVTNLDIHDSVKVEDIKFADGIEVMTDGDHIVANVVPQRVEEEVAPAAEGAEGAAGAEPEVISKGKKDEEGAEDGKAPAAKKEEKK